MKLFCVYAMDYLGSILLDELVLANSENEALEWYKANGEFQLDDYDSYDCYEIKEISGKSFEITLIEQ